MFLFMLLTNLIFASSIFATTPNYAHNVFSASSLDLTKHLHIFKKCLIHLAFANLHKKVIKTCILNSI